MEEQKSGIERRGIFALVGTACSPLGRSSAQAGFVALCQLI